MFTVVSVPAIRLAVVNLGIGALMLLSKSKKHFVGITWIEGDKEVRIRMQCDKSDYRGTRLLSCPGRRKLSCLF
jgi:hypothetical protein